MLYNSYRSYMKNRFGAPVMKISLSAGFSCPNRDGTKSVEGCSFCDNRSFSPALGSVEPVVKQLTDVMDRCKYRFKHFLPYLQPFSNTYGSAQQLREIYEPLVQVPGVIGLAVGTRPDCFSEEVFEYLEDLSGRTYLSIELGLQSGHNSVLERVNRGHSVEEFCSVAQRLYSIGAEVVAHVILGLPSETEEMMEQTARMLGSMECVGGVKVHQLMVIAGTSLAQSYHKDEIELYDICRYSDMLCRFLSLLRPEQHIHRLMADSKPDMGLIAPLWSIDKQRSLSFIHGYMEKISFVQGRRYCSVS